MESTLSYTVAQKNVLLLHLCSELCVRKTNLSIGILGHTMVESSESELLTIVRLFPVGNFEQVCGITRHAFYTILVTLRSKVTFNRQSPFLNV